MRLIYIMGAIVVALFVTWFVTRSKLQQQAIVDNPVEVIKEVVVQQEIPKVRVLVAAQPIKPGQLVQQNNLEFQDWPETLVRPEFKTEATVKLEDFVGAAPLVEIAAGEPILDGKLIQPGDKGFLAAVLRPGMKAVTFSVDRRSSVAGFVFPGDIIDVTISNQIEDRTRAVISSAKIFGQLSSSNNEPGRGNNLDLEFPKEFVTQTIIRDVKVLAVSARMARPETAYNDAETVTVELTPKLAEIIINASQFATLNIVLNPIRRTEEERARILAEGDMYPYLVSGVDTGTYSFTTQAETSPLTLLTLGGERIGQNFQQNSYQFGFGAKGIGNFNQLGIQSGTSYTVTIFRAGNQKDVFIRPVTRAQPETASPTSQIGGVSITPSLSTPDTVMTPPVFDSEAR